MTDGTTRVAVASATHGGLDDSIGQHFGRCRVFTLCEVDPGGIRVTQVAPNPFAAGHAPGDVPSFIQGTAANVLLVGGIGGRAIAFFEQMGVEVSAGHTGTVREAVEAWRSGAAGGAAACPGHEHGNPACGRTS